jgi:hypothetical protein
MRTFAFFGGVTIAAALFSAGALAWTEEKPSQQQDQSSVMYSDPDAFKALQDKVNAKGQNQSGFYFYGGVNPGDNGGTDKNSYTDTNSYTGTNPYAGANPYRVQPMTGSGSAFSYSPMPGFRGLPQ